MLGITSRAIVAINGTTVYDTDAHPVKYADGVYEHRFEAALAAGETLSRSAVSTRPHGAGRLPSGGGRGVGRPGAAGRGTYGGCPVDIEAQVSSIRLAHDVFYGEHEVGFRLGSAPTRRAADRPIGDR